MNFFTPILHLIGSGAVAYITASNMRDVKTRPNLLAGFQLAESGAVPFLETLSQRAATEGDRWLAERLACHAQDERRHGQIFAHALKQLDKQVIDFKTIQNTQTADKPKGQERSPFFAAYFEGYSKEDLSPENIDWLVFFASTYILELDASKDFLRMAHALPEADVRDVNLRKGILSIAQDEKGHAAYLREAMERRLSYFETAALIDEWRTRKVNAMLAMVGNLLRRNGQMPSMVQDGAPTDVSGEASDAGSDERSQGDAIAA